VEINKHNSGTNYLYPYRDSKKFDKTFFNKEPLKTYKNPIYELEHIPPYELEEGELISMEA
jgi:hypothetical protein